MDAPPGWGALPVQPVDVRPNGTIQMLGQIAMKEARFVERPLLQAGTFTLLSGRPSVGKGALCSRWVARCTNGLMYGRPRLALWLSSEDDPAIDLGPRVEVAGGDRMKVGLIPESFQLPRDIGWLRDTTVRMGDVGMIVVDPISGHIPGTNSNDDDEVRMALLPLGLLAAELDVPVVGIRHISTKEAKTGALAKILGSTAWVGVPRVVLAAAQDEHGDVHVQPVKGNRVRTSGGIRFRLEPRQIAGFAETVVAAVEQGESTVDIDTLVAAKTGGNGAAPPDLAAAIVAVLQTRDQVEDDQLAALIAETTGAKAGQVRAACFELRDRGWLRSHPIKNQFGVPVGWSVSLTNAAPSRPAPVTPEAGVAAGTVEPHAGSRPRDRTLDEALGDPTFLAELITDGIVESVA